MKRQRKNNKKMRMPKAVGDLKEAFFKRALNLAVIAIFILTLFVTAKAFLYRSDYFRLRVVEIKNSFLDRKAVSVISNQLLSTYRGRNLFRIDLTGIAGSLRSSYPDAREITAKIVLPDKLSVTMKFRKPVAIVHNIRSYPIDEEGVVLPSADQATLGDLPVIEGVDVRRQRQVISTNLALALDLLREIKASKLMADYGIEVIEAGDPRNLSFRLAKGPDIRIGSENFAERLDILEKTLKDPRLALDRISYIDLRFADVVIGPK